MMNHQKSLAFLVNFMKKHYRPLILLPITAGLLVLLHLFLGKGNIEVLKLALATGAAQMLFIRFSGNLAMDMHRKGKLSKWIGVLLSPHPASSLGMMLTALLSFAIFLSIAPVEVWNAYILTEVSLAFIVGSTAASLFYSAFGFRSDPITVHYRLDPERYDAFAGSIIAASFLGLTFIQPNVFYGSSMPLAGVYLPIFFGVSSILVTYLGAVIYEFIADKNPIYMQMVSILSAILLMALAQVLVYFFLPSTWMFEGKEYSPAVVLLALQAGILAGLSSGKLVKMYIYFARKHVDALLQKPFKGLIHTVSVRLFLNGFIASLPFLLVLSTLFFSWQLAELFGLTLSFLGMVSNVGVSLLVMDNELNPRKLQHISLIQRKKLEKISPSLKLLFAWPMRYFLRKVRMPNISVFTTS